MRRIAGGLIVLALGATVFARAASAATIPVSYVVDEKILKTLAPAGTLLTIELYEDSACSGAVAATAAVDVDAVTVKERIKTLKPKGSAQKVLKLVELHHVFTGVNPTPGADLFVKVTSAVPGAIDTTAVGACQAQEPASGGSVPALGQNGSTVFGTGSLTSPVSFTLLPNLSLTLNVPASSVLYVSTDGGALATGGFAIIDVALYVDGVPTNLLRRTQCGDNAYCDWNMAATMTLSAGIHTLQVRAAQSAGGGTATVSGATGSGTQGQLTALIIKQ